EYVPGQNIGEWISQTSSSASNTICSVGRDILEQCFRLDNTGLDHGELSRLTRHVIVSHKPCIIDFESSSTGRKTCNVTAAAQSIFLYGIVADKVRKILGNIDKEKVIRALRTYKHLPTRANFDGILGVLLPT
ncbi:MAG TPA: hypothetical protein VJ695_04955, partial [Nitrososphaera sp.]|nr:hypothetical protein [Nitrososphaera sp.]